MAGNGVIMKINPIKTDWYVTCLWLVFSPCLDRMEGQIAGVVRYCWGTGREGKIDFITWRSSVCCPSASLDTQCGTVDAELKVPSSERRGTPVYSSVQVQCCFFTSTETVRTIRDGEPRTATSTFTHLLSSGHFKVEGVLLLFLRPERPQGKGSPGRPPRLWHSSCALTVLEFKFSVHRDREDH